MGDSRENSKQQQSLLKSKRGQATVEYILILALAVIVSTTMSRGILKTMDTAILKFGGVFEKRLKTGRADIRVFIN